MPRCGSGARTCFSTTSGGHHGQHRRHRLDPHQRESRAADDARPRTLLRRHGPGAERAQHDDDVLRRARPHQRAVGALRLLDGVRRRHRRRSPRRPVPVRRPARPDGGRHLHPGRAPGDGLRRLPGGLRDHHRGAGLRRGGGADEVRRLDGLRRDLGDAGLLPGRALGLRLLPRRPRRRLDRQRPRGDRLRGRHGRPHQRGCRGPGPGDRDGHAAAASAPRRCARTTCRW